MILAVGVLFEGLQLGERNDVDLLADRSLPHGLHGRCIVVVIPASFRVEQLPPLVCVRPLSAIHSFIHSFSQSVIHIATLYRSTTHTLAPTGGSQAHCPVVRFANICCRVCGSTISTHSSWLQISPSFSQIRHCSPHLALVAPEVVSISSIFFCSSSSARACGGTCLCSSRLPPRSYWHRPFCLSGFKKPSLQINTVIYRFSMNQN